MSKVSYEFQRCVDGTLASIKRQTESRTYRASNELRNSALLVLRGQRNGRRYKVPGTYGKQRDPSDGKMKNGRYYTASAPGEPPAARTGNFRISWRPNPRVDGDKYVAVIESRIKTENGKYLLGDILEDGTSRMAPRPYKDRIRDKAEPDIVRIFSEPYF